MPRYDNQKSSSSHKRFRDERESRGRFCFHWLDHVLDDQTHSKREFNKEDRENGGKRTVFEDEDHVNHAESTESKELPQENLSENQEEELPSKRIRTRSVDMEEEENLYSLSRYRISPETIGILNSKGINELFPIQALTFDSVYDGKDLIGRAPTGQGKTLAFALPIIERIYKLGLSPPRRSRAPLVLILSPTRELAQQIDEQVRMVAPSLRSLCLYVAMNDEYL